MKGKILLSIAVGIALSGCSSNRLVKMDRLDPEDALKVPAYMLEAQPSNIGIGEGRADQPQQSRQIAMHYASVDLCTKLGGRTDSRTRSTASQNSKGGRSRTSVTETIASETRCSAMVNLPDVLDVQTVQFGREFVTWTRIQSDDVSEPVDNSFSDQDQRVADNLRVN